MGTLYVTPLPLGDLEDLTFRAQRLLRQVKLLVSVDMPAAERLRRRYEIATPLVGAGQTELLWGALATGDAMLLLDGDESSPPAPAETIIESAIDRGHAAVAVPGPTFPITALITSGLPSDSFVYVGQLPADPESRRELLTSAAGERRSLVMVPGVTRVATLWPELREVLGKRRLVVVTQRESRAEVSWRGTTEEAESVPEPAAEGSPVLVAGGASPEPARWSEEQLQAQILAYVERGLSPGEISRLLADASGWPRREVYRRVVRAG